MMMAVITHIGAANSSHSLQGWIETNNVNKVLVVVATANLQQTSHRSSSLLSPHPSRPLHRMAVDRHSLLSHVNVPFGQVRAAKFQQLVEAQEEKTSTLTMLADVFVLVAAVDAVGHSIAEDILRQTLARLALPGVLVAFDAYDEMRIKEMVRGYDHQHNHHDHHAHPCSSPPRPSHRHTPTCRCTPSHGTDIDRRSDTGRPPSGNLRKQSDKVGLVITSIVISSSSKLNELSLN